MPVRLRVDPHPTDVRVRIVGHPRKGLVLLRGEDDRVRFRSERIVGDWRRHFGIIRRDAAAVDEVLSAHGLGMRQPGQWPKVLKIVRSQLDG